MKFFIITSLIYSGSLHRPHLWLDKFQRFLICSISLSYNCWHDKQFLCIFKKKKKLKLMRKGTLEKKLQSPLRHSGHAHLTVGISASPQKCQRSLLFSLLSLSWMTALKESAQASLGAPTAVFHAHVASSVRASLVKARGSILTLLRYLSYRLKPCSGWESPF